MLKNKIKLVAKGYDQQEGVDFDETYVHVVILKSIIMLLAFSCITSFKL